MAGFVAGAKRIGLTVTSERAFHHKYRDECWSWAASLNQKAADLSRMKEAYDGRERALESDRLVIDRFRLTLDRTSEIQISLFNRMIDEYNQRVGLGFPSSNVAMRKSTLLRSFLEPTVQILTRCKG